MSPARDEVLARVRSALQGGPAAGPVPRRYRRVGTSDADARVDLLTQRLLDYRARVERTGDDGVADVLHELAGDRRFGVPPGLPASWRPQNAVEDHGLGGDELDALDGVVTGCTVAIAETGTLVLTGGEAEGRRALTLVPDVHICVARARQIVETVPEAFEALAGRERRPITFVSGPSATSDIELVRVEGVHGPRTLVVVIVDEPH